MSKSTTKASRLTFLAAGWGTFLLSFGLQFVYILNHFYSDGAYCEDSGIFACMMWRAGICGLPLSIGLGTPTYMQVHMTWLAALFSLVSYAVPVDHVSWFAFYMGCSFGLLAFSVYYAGIKLVGGYGPWTWAFIGTCLAQCGLSIEVAQYPHHEIAAVGLMTLFWTEFLRRRRFSSALFFLLAVSVREDVGFHICALLTLLWLYKVALRQSDPGRGWAAVFAMAGFAFSLLDLGVQRWAFSHNSTFATTYAQGSASEAWLRVQQHLLYMLHHRAYLWAPLLMTVLIAIRRRSLVLLLAVAAYLPWLLLHLQAVREPVATLFGYYAYPFYNPIVWILFAPVEQGSLDRWGGRTIAREFLGVLVVSLLALASQNPGSIRAYCLRIWPRPEIRANMVARRQLAKLDVSQWPEVSTMGDSAVFSLAPWVFPVRLQPTGPAPRMLFFWRDYPIEQELVHQRLLRMKSPAIYRLGDSRVCLAVTRPVAQFAEFLRPWRLSTLLWATHYVGSGRPGRNDSFEVSPGNGVFLNSYLDNMEAGRYRIVYLIEADSPTGLEVVFTSAQSEIIRSKLPLGKKGKQEVGVEFTLSGAVPRFGVDVLVSEHAKVLVSDCQFERI
ncbi:MAG: hypothetical protein KF760_06880 [Candidatus Eremiobacteraeota bacterium]|nr:hypothetical protein [Candidatus Eremiobacteraeota bacterium]MCW5866782.1 hypothetical protein [Candidatus Eremiobacteraeota bacterium]